MTGLDQAARHRKTHFAEADESDFHGVVPDKCGDGPRS
jgi:hypothetical protein